MTGNAPQKETPSVRPETFLAVLQQGCSSASATVSEALATCAPAEPMKVRLAFSKLGRTVPSAALHASELSEQLVGLHSPDFFATDIVARMAFLSGLTELVPEAEFPALLVTLYRGGSQAEQVSVLRSLPWLPGPTRFVSVASEACRTNDVRVFSALAIDNPFPAQHLPDPALFQMVLKAMFLEVDTRKTLGLEARVNQELVRMVSDFAAERTAAGRATPQDAQALLTTH